MFLVKKGTISVRKRRGSGYVEVAKVHANEVLGELSFFDRQPRSASAVALTDVEALEIDFASLDKIYTQVPDYIQSIMNCVADRLRKANDTIRRLKQEVIYEDTARETGEPEMSEAEQILAATQDIDVSEIVKKRADE
jgi:CRP-like cAMP-binding protein